ncbi:hypothetical protein GCK32_002531 [Trichostrongylus colubriformis]|uniref:Uncharacterized protein n=1 Tax=Trichostrongylus colubriformis TaxID=6319 RepID=A0AAN8FY33_TRICO
MIPNFADDTEYYMFILSTAATVSLFFCSLSHKKRTDIGERELATGSFRDSMGLPPRISFNQRGEMKLYHAQPKKKERSQEKGTKGKRVSSSSTTSSTPGSSEVTRSESLEVMKKQHRKRFYGKFLRGKQRSGTITGAESQVSKTESTQFD